ncbi:MAG: hypothetical protein RSD07_08140 [Angelakisella sp.]
MRKSNDFTELLNGRLIPKGMAGYRFEKEGHRQYRDCLVVYCDGKMRFERYCYGEAAGLVFGVWVDKIAPDGTITYCEPFDIAVKPDVLPKKISSMPDAETLTIDDKPELWKVAAKLKTNPQNGYTWIKVLLLSITKK